MSRSLVVAIALLLSACSSPPKAEHAAPPAKVENAPKEAGLSTVTLTAEAEGRLGVKTVPVDERLLAGARRVGGEVVVPPGRSLTVTAPLAGTLLPPASESVPSAGSPVRKGQVVFRLRALPGAAEVGASEARLAAARAKVRRTELLLEAGAASERALEEARADLAALEAGSRALSPGADAGEGDLLLLSSPQDGVIGGLRAAAGQSVAAAAALFEIVAAHPLWVRVPVYAGDPASIDTPPGAVLHLLSEPAGSPGRKLAPVPGVPTADPLSATSDLFFEVANLDRVLRPGQRVEVMLRLRQPEKVRVVPWPAVVYDIDGGAWVYENTAPHVFVRRRVEVRRVEGDLAVVASGPAPGALVVAVGAAELFGTELGPGK